jgi:histidine kinase
MVWDLSRIEKSKVVLSLDDVTCDKIKQLPDSTQLALQVCACIGSKTSYEVLGILVREVCLENKSAFDPGAEAASIGQDVISPAIKDGLLAERQEGIGVSFIHDSIETAAYSLLQTEDQSQFHWKLGQILKSELSSDKMSPDQLFIVANQFARGVEFVQEYERMEVLKILTSASQESRMVGDFRGAHYFYEVAIERLLFSADWDLNYGLCCNIYLSAAENALWAGELHFTDRWLNLLDRHTKNSTTIGLKALWVRVNWISSYRTSEDAVDHGLKALRSLIGIKIISKNWKVRCLVRMEYTRYFILNLNNISQIRLPHF